MEGGDKEISVLTQSAPQKATLPQSTQIEVITAPQLYMDVMENVKAGSPSAPVLSGEAPQERREETVFSDADSAAYISGVLPFLVSGCNDDDGDNDNSDDDVFDLHKTLQGLRNCCSENKGIGDAGSTADIRMLCLPWSAIVCLGCCWFSC